MSTTIRPARRVLIVHDDEHLQRMMSHALRDYGIEPLNLLRPWRVVEVAADEQPDLILIDVEMGYHRGNLIEELKVDPRTRRVALFMHGRKDTQYDRLLAFELGADDYFGRPFQPDVLARRIALHIDALRRLQEQEFPMRSPADTLPDLVEIDRQQLELLRADENKRESSPAIRTSAPPVAPRPVLIVEDDKDIRDSISHLLEVEGIPTLTASNGEEALEVLRTSRERPSVVLLDLMMPVMNGWEFRKRMESDRSIPSPKLVVVSALSPDATLGDAVWLRKPLGVEELLSTVQQLAAS